MQGSTRSSSVGAHGGHTGHIPAPPRPPYARTVELHGHIIDSHILSQVMDLVRDRGA